MACHLPLSVEAQAEARTLMLSINNILSTKDGKPVAIPSQEMILGAYYLTIVEQSKAEEDTMDVSQLHCYTGYDEVMLAYTLKKLKIHDFIKVDIPGHGLVVTTTGRLIFNFVLQEQMSGWTGSTGYHHRQEADGQARQRYLQETGLYRNRKTAG